MGSLLLVAERFLPDRGGLGVATSRIAAQASERGERVHVVRLDPAARPGDRGRERRGDLTIHPVGPLPKEDETAGALAGHLRDLVRRESIDLVHSVYAGRAAYVATLVAAELAVPSLVSLRGNDLDRGLYRASDLAFLRETLPRATRVTAVSRQLARTAERLFGRPVDHVTNSVDTALFHPVSPSESLRASLGAVAGATIAFVGELREKKGARFLLPAFAELARRRPATLLLVGGVRDDSRGVLESFEQVAPEAANRVVIVPYQRDAGHLCAVLALADVVVFPSLWEGTPNALLEAMAAARPVLATDVGGHLDLIEHDRTGMLLPLSELSRLPDALEELLALPEARRAELGEAARSFVAREHAPARESEAYARIYAEARASTRSS